MTLHKDQSTYTLESDSRPVFFQPTDIPFTTWQNVKNESERVFQEGVFEPIDFRYYATLIAPVSKPNEKFSFWGDFEILNQQISVDQHSLPKLEDLWGRLRGCTRFTKINLAEAYLKLELDNKAKKPCVINTPFGLFRYNRMCFWLASSLISTISQMYGYNDSWFTWSSHLLRQSYDNR